MSQYDKTTEAKAEEFASLGVMPEAASEMHEPGRVREAFKAGRASAKGSLELAIEALEEIGAPLGVPLSLVQGDIRQACRDLNQEREDKRKRACEALAAIRERGDYP